MKLKNLFFMLLAIPMVFVACDAPKDEAAGKTELILSETSIEAEAEGGPQLITFEIKNAVSGKSVAATCEAAWVNDIQVADYITFNIDANTEAEQREAKLVVTYDAIVVEVAISQKGKPASTKPVFTVDADATYEYDCKEQAGVINFTLENPIAGVDVEASTTAEWISQVTVSMETSSVSFLVAANEGEARTATITLEYGLLNPIVVTVSQSEYVDPSEAVVPFVITECWASSEDGGKQWDVIFVENDPMKGPMQTRISFALAEANTQRVSDGTYSVENGGILLNSYTENGKSTYRHNASDSADILDATFTVATDIDAKTISIEGTFKVGDKNFGIEYNGEMRGMDLGEAVSGAIEYNEWASANSTYCGTKECLFTLKSADGNFSIVIDIYHSGGSKIIPAGTYDVKDYATGLNDYANSGTEIIYNSVDADVATGSVVIEQISGGYKVTFDIVDTIDRNFKGSYEGPISGKAQNPA